MPWGLLARRQVLPLHGQERSKKVGFLAQGIKPGAEDPPYDGLGVSCPKKANWGAELKAQTCSCFVWLGARSITLVASPIATATTRAPHPASRVLVLKECSGSGISPVLLCAETHPTR